MIHSKVMVIDDRFLRIGSANMNNRSMGADSECDLAIEANSPAERRAIVEIRNRLIGEHCGMTATDVAPALIRQRNSLIAVADTLTANGHSLRPIDDGELDEGEVAGYVEEIADPKQPFRLSDLGRSLISHIGAGAAAWKIAMAVVLIGALSFAWYVTPLAEWTDSDTVRGWLRHTTQQRWAGLLVIGTFVAGGLVAFPVVILIAATVAAFGPWLGFIYATLGVLASALALYGIGARFGQNALRRLLGPRLDRVRARIVGRGVLAVAAVRVVPIAPFTLVNLTLGASAITLVDYVIGTIRGMLPGLIVMSTLGHRIYAIISDPSIEEVSLLALAVSGWVAVSLGVQALISRLWSSAP